MGLYEKTKRVIEMEQEQMKLLGGVALTPMERADVDQTMGVIADILGFQLASSIHDKTKLFRTEAGNWVITLDDTFEFKKMPGYQVEITMLEKICTARCHSFITGREDFLNLMRSHLQHADHEPNQQF